METPSASLTQATSHGRDGASRISISRRRLTWLAQWFSELEVIQTEASKENCAIKVNKVSVSWSWLFHPTESFDVKTEVIKGCFMFSLRHVSVSAAMNQRVIVNSWHIFESQSFNNVIITITFVALHNPLSSLTHRAALEAVTKEVSQWISFSDSY